MHYALSGNKLWTKDCFAIILLHPSLSEDLCGTQLLSADLRRTPSLWADLCGTLSLLVDLCGTPNCICIFWVNLRVGDPSGNRLCSTCRSKSIAVRQAGRLLVMFHHQRECPGSPTCPWRPLKGFYMFPSCWATAAAAVKVLSFQVRLLDFCCSALVGLSRGQNWAESAKGSERYGPIVYSNCFISGIIITWTQHANFNVLFDNTSIN